ncbi:hypothetical protein CSKR_201688 [Clonorchis sinensis]|uniref:Uncharacterized protein n=1 Tax=Clonorchis sinensis TaxID=79923 RepID=A0A8T1MUM9_CLOSI|nr:hypothetical protein CSKR_201688 [Clonorchis sinensis]
MEAVTRYKVVDLMFDDVGQTLGCYVEVTKETGDDSDVTWLAKMNRELKSNDRYTFVAVTPHQVHTTRLASTAERRKKIMTQFERRPGKGETSSFKNIYNRKIRKTASTNSKPKRMNKVELFMYAVSLLPTRFLFHSIPS